MTAHSTLPRHCATCGVDWPPARRGLCHECGAGLPCRADTTDAVAPDPPCAGSTTRIAALHAAIADRRADKAFTERLATRMNEDAGLMARLAETDTASGDTS